MFSARDLPRAVVLALCVAATAISCGPSPPSWASLAREKLQIGPSRGLGFLVKGEQPREVFADVPRGAALRFFAAGESLGVAPAEEPVVRFEVLYAGEVLWKKERRLGEAWDHWYEVELPTRAQRRARFEFRVEGSLDASCGYLCPTLAPADRAGPSSNCNLIVFVVEGIRLERDGRLVPEENAPHLTSLSRRSQAFLLSELRPGELTQGLEALALDLAAKGYRTAGLRENEVCAGLRSPEWCFSTAHSATSRTLLLKRGLEFLARSDGRPSALFMFSRAARTDSEDLTNDDGLLQLDVDVKAWRARVSRATPDFQTVFAFLSLDETSAFAALHANEEPEPDFEMSVVSLVSFLNRCREVSLER